LRVDDTPENNLGLAAIIEKGVYGASKCSVEKPAHGGFQIRLASQNAPEIMLNCMASLDAERIIG